MLLKSVPFGKYHLMRPLIFSLVPRSHEEYHIGQSAHRASGVRSLILLFYLLFMILLMVE